jgi:hypothetical protein
MSVSSITTDTTGVFDIRTAAGTSYVLELGADGDHLTRKPGMARPAGYEEPLRLPGDFERVPLVERPAISVGTPVAFAVVVDGALARRETAPITTIEVI